MEATNLGQAMRGKLLYVIFCFSSPQNATLLVRIFYCFEPALFPQKMLN